MLDRAFASLFAAGALRAVLIGDGRLFPVAFSALSPDRVREALPADKSPWAEGTPNAALFPDR